MQNIILKLLVWLKLLKPTSVGQIPEYVGQDPKVNHPAPSEHGRITLGLIVGHEKKAPGANLFGGGNEYTYNSEIAAIVKQMCAGSNIDCKVIFRDGIGIDGAYKRAFDLGCDCVIELHFNAFNKSATGTLTYTSTASEDVAFSHVVHKAMVGVFGTEGRRDRGVVSLGRRDRGGRNVYSFNGMPNCLVEPLFGDVESEAKLAIAKKREYAAALVQAVTTWARKQDML